MTGQIVSVIRRGDSVSAAVRVNEGDGTGPREYLATVPAVGPDGQPLSAADLKAALVQAWQAQRAARPAPPQDLSALIQGPVNL